MVVFCLLGAAYDCSCLGLCVSVDLGLFAMTVLLCPGGFTWFAWV